MIEARHLVTEVIRPALKRLDAHSVAAEMLVLGTACQESRCGQYLKQLGDGPALGIFQMEPATHRDIWENFLAWKLKLKDKLYSLIPPAAQQAGPPDPRLMTWNLQYAAAMCRLHYLRVKDPVPLAVEQQAQYWKTHYNTSQGAGTASEYISNWNRFAGGIYNGR